MEILANQIMNRLRCFELDIDCTNLIHNRTFTFQFVHNLQDGMTLTIPCTRSPYIQIVFPTLALLRGTKLDLKLIQTMATVKIFAIGINNHGEFGFVHDDAVPTLTQLTNTSITKATTCRDYIIYSNNNHSKIWASGNNRSGQLGIGQSVSNNLPLDVDRLLQSHISSKITLSLNKYVKTHLVMLPFLYQIKVNYTDAVVMEWGEWPSIHR